MRYCWRMIVREILPAEKELYNKTVQHVIQSWEWGQFRQKTGVKVIRLGLFDNSRLVSAYQLTIHPLPFFSFNVGYLPKSPIPEPEVFLALQKIARENNCLFIKLELNVEKTDGSVSHIKELLEKRPNFVLSPKPLFTKYNFVLDLTKSEDELLAQMKEKTRYNVRLAEKRGVEIAVHTDDAAFEVYQRLYFETTKRQKYFGHTLEYHRLMWETLQPAGIAQILIASYQRSPQTAWMLFKFGSALYYPYGGSSIEHREAMASNLIMWEAIKLGKKLNCTSFDLWGALGPEAKQNNPWQGFHRFKEGYGARLVEYVGTYDLVINKQLYALFNLGDKLRWQFLRLKSKFLR